MVFTISCFGDDGDYSYFCSKKVQKMTQKEAIIEALNLLGGKANLNDIYRFAYTLADFSGSKDWKATIRWYLQKETDSFRSTKRGSWELLSYQEEIASRDKRIKELEEENSRLKTIKTEDAFVEIILKETKKRFKHESEHIKAVAVSQILAWAGREDASENLDEWLEGKEKPFIAVNGDYVVNKHVENEIDNIEAGGTGVNINKEKD